MKKTDLVHVRIDPETKQQVEEIFDRLGVNTSYAVNMFFNQVILNEGFPFDVRIPKPEMSEAEKLAKAIDSTGGNGSVSLRNQKILHLLAEGDIDYETAVFALKRSFA